MNSNDKSGFDLQQAMDEMEYNKARAEANPEIQEEFSSEYMYCDPNNFYETKKLYKQFGYKYSLHLWVLQQQQFAEADKKDKSVNTNIFTLEEAISLASEKHKGQTDKAGQPYILHPLAVMNTVQGDTAKMAGVLHDIVEDTPVTFDELRQLGCPEAVVEAVKLVTHAEDFDGSNESYMADIKNIVDSGNQTAIDVKWADITHNQDLSRIPSPTEKDRNRLNRYAKAKEALKPLVSGYLK